MRSDLRYGMDDATLWPQFYHSSYPHLAAIPAKPSYESDYLWVLWWVPKISDFVQSKGAGVSGLGLIAGQEMEMLETRKETLFDDTRRYLKSHGSVMISSSLNICNHCWVRLRFLPGTYEGKCLEVVEFQRTFLDLYGAWEFEAKYLPRMHSTNVDIGVDENRVGCFTVQPHIAQEFFSAGPVWFVHPLESIGEELPLKEVVPILEAKPDIRLDHRPNQHYPVIYRGPANDAQHYVMQHKFMHTRMVYVNPVDGKRVKNPRADQIESLEAESHTQSLTSLKSQLSVDNKRSRGSQPCKP